MSLVTEKPKRWLKGGGDSWRRECEWRLVSRGQNRRLTNYVPLVLKHRMSLLLLLPSHFSRVRLCVTPWTAAHQASLSLWFSKQEHWSGLPFPSPVHESEKWKWSRSVEFDSAQPHGLQPTRLLCPWDCPGKSTGVGCHFLLHRMSLTT